MFSKAFPMRRVRAAAVLIVALFAAATTVAAQQAPDPAGVAGSGVAQASPAPAVETQQSTTGSSTAGPRLTSQFQEYEPSLPGSAAEDKSLASSGGQHTIVISTLVLVLAVIIIVLLVAD